MDHVYKQNRFTQSCCTKHVSLLFLRTCHEKFKLPLMSLHTLHITSAIDAQGGEQTIHTTLVIGKHSLWLLGILKKCMYACQKCQKWFKLQWLLPPHVSPCRSGCRCGIVCFTCFCASVYVSAALTRRVKIIKNQWHNTLEQRSEMACRRIAI